MTAERAQAEPEHTVTDTTAAEPYCTGDRCDECTPDEPCCEATCGACPRADCWLAPGAHEDSKYCDEHGEGWLMDRSPQAQAMYEILRRA